MPDCRNSLPSKEPGSIPLAPTISISEITVSSRFNSYQAGKARGLFDCSIGFGEILLKQLPSGKNSQEFETFWVGTPPRNRPEGTPEKSLCKV
jgi:hypothetical protein